jgi:hypothetical protein
LRRPLRGDNPGCSLRHTLRNPNLSNQIDLQTLLRA